MTEATTAVAGPEFKDRKTALCVFGAIGIVVGVICALMIPLLIFSMMMSHMAAQNADAQPTTAPAATASATAMIPGVLVYTLLAVWFIWMGVGSTKARRWARVLILVSAWLWLVTGLAIMAYILTVRPDMFGPIVQQGKMPAAMAATVTKVVLVAMSVLLVVVPGILVCLYGGRNVKATCEQLDPKVRWTDKCPLPVLAISFGCVLWACSMPLAGFRNWSLPFFGTTLTGAAGAIASLVLMALCVYAAWGTYRLRATAWWAAILLMVLGTLAPGITFLHGGAAKIAGGTGATTQQIEAMKSFMPSQSAMLLMYGLWLFGGLAYLLYARRFFVRQPAAEV